MDNHPQDKIQFRYALEQLATERGRTLLVHESLKEIDTHLTIVHQSTPFLYPKKTNNKNNFLQKMKAILSRWFTLVFILVVQISFSQDYKPENSKSWEMMDKVYETMNTGDMKLAFRQIDSAIVIGHQENIPGALARAYNAKAEYMRMMREPEAEGYFKKSLKYYLEIDATGVEGVTVDLFHTYTILGEYKYHAGDIDSALYYYHLAGDYDHGKNVKGDSNEKAHYTFIGRIYSDQGKVDMAIEAYLKVIEAKPNDKRLQAAYDQLGVLYNRLGDLERANFYIDLAYDLLKGRTDRYVAVNRVNKANVAIADSKFKEAEAFAKEAIEVLVQSENTALLSFAKVPLFNAFFYQEKYEEAGKIINEIKISDYEKYTLGILNFLKSKIRWAFHTNELTEIPTLLEKGMEYSRSKNLLYELEYFYKYGAEYYQKTKNLEMEAQFLRTGKLLSDSLFDIRRSQYANNLETRYKTKEQKQTIDKLELEDELKVAQLQTQRSIIGAGILGLTLLGGFLFLLFRRNRKIKEQNEIIAKALSEKDILLREIHHRVKNNLQLVSSLLGLQGLSAKDEEIKEAINAGKSRVMSMALIHQDLYNKEKLTSVNVKEYLEKLCRELISTYQLSTDQVKLQTEIEELDLDVDSLIPLGLIINELLTNSLKYAFPDDQKGIINIKLFEKANILYLEVNDDGIGLSEKVGSNSSFGFRMIKSLLRQLDGEMQSNGTNGSSFHFQFKDYKKAS